MPFDAALTAWATLALAVLAFAAAIVAGCAWRAQARELDELKKVSGKQIPVLEGQRTELEASRDLREREERERRERFVSQVFCWKEIGSDRRVTNAQVAWGTPRPTVCITYVRNAGPVPVYDFGYGYWIDGRLDDFVNRVTPLMPPGVERREGESAEYFTQVIHPGTDTDTITVAVFIRDASGNRWRIRPGGRYEPYTDDMLAPGTWDTT